MGVFALGYALLPTLPLVLWFMVTLFDALHHTPREPGLIVPPVHEGPVATAPVVELDAEARDLEPPVDDMEAAVDGR